MSSLLPIYVNSPNSSTAIGDNESSIKSGPQGSTDHSNLSGQVSSPAFAQVLRDSHGAPKILENLPSLASAEPQDGGTSQSLPAPYFFPNLETLAGTNEFVSAQAQKTLFEQAPLPVSIQISSEDRTLGLVRQAVDTEAINGGTGPVSRQVPFPKVPEFGVLPLTSVDKPTSSLLKQEEGILRPLIATSAKEIPSGLLPANRVNQEEGLLKFSATPRPQNPQIGTPALPPNVSSPVTAVLPDGPAGFAQTDSTSPLSLKPIPGFSSIVNDGSSPIIENRTTVQGDPLGDTGLFNKGDRSQTMVETSIKSVGLDLSGGQGLGSGMNYSPNSQSGFQQPSAFPGQGLGLRSLEGRVVEFPTQALQRLQMDVQLSEHQRVSIDVGVQNRQVYAGLVTDHAVLRNLATQFVPQLENQLADVDMELQEFSAEVREERQQQDDVAFGHAKHTDQGSEPSSLSKLPLSKNSLNRQGEPGLHLVA